MINPGVGETYEFLISAGYTVIGPGDRKIGQFYT